MSQGKPDAVTDIGFSKIRYGIIHHLPGHFTQVELVGAYDGEGNPVTQLLGHLNQTFFSAVIKQSSIRIRHEFHVEKGWLVELVKDIQASSEIFYCLGGHVIIDEDGRDNSMLDQ